MAIERIIRSTLLDRENRVWLSQPACGQTHAPCSGWMKNGRRSARTPRARSAARTPPRSERQLYPWCSWHPFKLESCTSLAMLYEAKKKYVRGRSRRTSESRGRLQLQILQYMISSHIQMSDIGIFIYISSCVLTIYTSLNVLLL